MNYVAQKFARVGHRQQQHRQLQPNLTRPERRRSDDGLRSRRRHELVRGDRTNRRRSSCGDRTRAKRIRSSFTTCSRGCSNGAKLYVVDPRRTARARWADGWLGLDVGSDIALANAIGREILAAGLENREFIERATSGFESYRAMRRAVHAGVRGEDDRRSGASVIARTGARLRERASAPALLDARHHRASQRRRQRARARSTSRC